MQNNEERLWELLAKKLAGEIADEELKELYDLLTNPALQLTDGQTLQHLWAKSLSNSSSLQPDIDKNWEQLQQMLFPEKSNLFVTAPELTGKEKPAQKRKWFYAAAAILVLISAASVYFYYNSALNNASANHKSDSANQIVSRNGSKTSVTLPDDTKVWLNAGSKIDYSNNFLRKREVYLTGEAYFDVTHNPDVPFMIHAANINIKVLGTILNIKAYAEDDRVETALVKGSVEITTNEDPKRSILLRPSEKIIILKTVGHADTGMQKTNAGKINDANPEFYSIVRMEQSKQDSMPEDIAWIKEKLIFKSESFLQLAKRMERWYGVDFVFEDEAVEKIKFTGEFDNQNIVQALDALAFSCNYRFRYRMDKSKVHIQPR